MPTRTLSTWRSRLEALGLWYDQLLAESLGKNGRGAFPLTVVYARALHSRGQQHQRAEGRMTGINPYGQPGVEAYKKNANAILGR